MNTDEDDPERMGQTDRRRLLKYAVLATLAGLGGIGVAVTVPEPRREQTEGPPAATPVMTPATETATPPATATPEATAPDLLALVERFAPDLYFDRRERWFPTDPRPYVRDEGGRTVVDGFDALSGYTRKMRASGTPPDPTVFYHVVPVGNSVVALQYWMYSVFDQFTVNFHWHDWELLQVFVDTETNEVLLLIASAHSRQCPNNEVLHPDLGPSGRPVVLSELGSHSSATDVNGNLPHFERVSVGGLSPDVTNASVVPLDGFSAQPFAYGLPRDEGALLPFALPELDGVPLPEHPNLADVTLEDFVDADVTVRSWRELTRPPSGLPAREDGLVLSAAQSQTRGDATYELVSIDGIRETIDDFTGPQLSFEFTIPGFVEDRVADHITASGVPWAGARFSDPAADITDPAHRREIVGDSPQGLANRVVGVVSVLLGRPDGELDAVESEDREDVAPFIPVSRFPVPVEVACLLRSDPVAIPTVGGVFRFVTVEPGVHDLVINGPGLAPYAERFEYTGGTARRGAAGRVTLVANEDAVRLQGDRRATTGVRRIRVVETFAGPVFDARPVETDRFAIPVHREGRYLVEITDHDGVRGTVRIGGEELERGRIPPIDTGKAALAGTLGEFLAEATATARELTREPQSDVELPVWAEFDLAARDASEAAEMAAGGDAASANELLEGIVDRLLRIRRRLLDADDEGYTRVAASALRHLAADGIDQAEAAYATPIAG